MPGVSSVAHYRLLERIGQGGMGVVYKAQDTRLGRTVALKFLPAESMADPDRKRRFIQEAQAASGLNHPHIVTIHDIGVAEDGSGYIAMEYLPGKTLLECISRGGLPIAEVLKYAVQIAGALAAAHAAGIVHRDIKPGNIVVGTNGQVKVLDFGVAKLTDPIPSQLLSTETAGLAQRPETREGHLLGTLAYMSPEQAQGAAVDSRSDIFSFGAVLYEMVSGRRAFHGPTPASTMSALLRDEPTPLAAVRPETPRELARVIELCLRKDPARRFQRIDDVQLLLEGLAEDLQLRSPAPAPAPAAPPRRNKLIVGAIVVCLVAAGVLWLMLRSRPDVSEGPPDRITSDLGVTSDPAISADGTLLAYASDRAGDNLDIWVQQLPRGKPVRLTHSAADDEAPAFSPDGSKIVFHSKAGVYIVSTLGGDEPRLIAAGGREPQFSPDGSQIAYWVGDPHNFTRFGKVFVAPIAGGAPRQIAPEFADARYPLWSPNGAYLLYQGVREPGTEPDWWISPVPPTGRLLETQAFPLIHREGLTPWLGAGGWKDRYIYFAARKGDASKLWRIALVPPLWRAQGAPEQLTFGTGTDAQPRLASGGRLIYSNITSNNNLWSFSSGATDSADPLRRLNESDTPTKCPSISADGTVIAYLSQRGGEEIRTLNLATSHESTLTIVGGEKSPPVLTADGARVAYSVVENGLRPIYAAPVRSDAGSAVIEKICQNCGEPSSWSPDTTKVLFASGKPRRIAVLDVSSGATVPLLQHATWDLDHGQISPDGRWVSFVAAVAASRTRIYVAPLRAELVPESEWAPVTDGSAWDDKPHWHPAGNALYFYSKREDFGCIWKQRMDPARGRPIGEPIAVRHFHRPRMSLIRLSLGAFDFGVARDTVVVNLLGLMSNIWTTTVQEKH